MWSYLLTFFSGMFFSTIYFTYCPHRALQLAMLKNFMSGFVSMMFAQICDPTMREKEEHYIYKQGQVRARLNPPSKK